MSLSFTTVDALLALLIVALCLVIVFLGLFVIEMVVDMIWKRRR